MASTAGEKRRLTASLLEVLLRSHSSDGGQPGDAAVIVKGTDEELASYSRHGACFFGVVTSVARARLRLGRDLRFEGESKRHRI